MSKFKNTFRTLKPVYDVDANTVLTLLKSDTFYKVSKKCTETVKSEILEFYKLFFSVISY